MAETEWQSALYMCLREPCSEQVQLNFDFDYPCCFSRPTISTIFGTLATELQSKV
jgi:hypothetical protein